MNLEVKESIFSQDYQQRYHERNTFNLSFIMWVGIQQRENSGKAFQTEGDSHKGAIEALMSSSNIENNYFSTAF